MPSRATRGGMPVVMLHGITDSWRSFESVMAHLPAVAARLRAEPARTRRVGPSGPLPHARLRRRCGGVHRGARPRPGARRRAFDGQRERDAARHRPARPASRSGDGGRLCRLSRQGRARRVQSQRHRAAARPDRPGLRGRVAAEHAGATGAAGVLRHGRARVPAGSGGRLARRVRARSSTTTSLPRSTASPCPRSSSGAIATRCARPATRSGSSGRSRARVCSPTQARGMRCIGKSPHALPTTLLASPAPWLHPLFQGDIAMTTMTDDAAVAAKSARTRHRCRSRRCPRLPGQHGLGPCGRACREGAVADAVVLRQCAGRPRRGDRRGSDLGAGRT